MVKRFNVVIGKEGGGIELYAMKEWLRRHPEAVPAGLDPTSSTSHQLRNGLRKRGWVVQDSTTEVRLIPPDSGTSEAVVSSLLGNEEEEQEDAVDADETHFGLEYQLRDFIAQNLSTISVGGNRLRLYVDASGKEGIEFSTDVGLIDILAVDERGSFFVFELKRARSPDRAVGQLTRYMGWVRQTIGKGKEVNGVIVAKSITNNLRYAVTVVPNVQLFEYDVTFTLRPAQDIKS